MPTASNIITVNLMREGGATQIPTDSGYGQVVWGRHTGQPSGRIATLETLFDYFINYVPDPDTALAQDPDFEQKLRQQPDVHATMRLRELTVASMPAHIEPSHEKGVDPQAAQIVADYTEDVFRKLPNRADLYRQMQTAVLIGGQAHEWTWAKVNGYPRPVVFDPVHKSRFIFDRLGNMALLTRDAPVWGKYVQPNPNHFPSGYVAMNVPGGKFTYHKYMSEPGSWNRPAFEGFTYWGRGEDTNLFIPVTFDNFVLRFRMKWLEKHGMPLTILYHSQGDQFTSEVLRIADSLRGESVVTIPRQAGEEHDGFYKLEFVDPPAIGHDAFAQFSDEWTKPRVEKIILGGANLTEVGETGSYGATVDQRDAGSTIIFRYDAKNIDETLNNQIVPYIVQARWPGIPEAYYPKHILQPQREEDQEHRMRVLRAAAEMVEVRQDDVYQAAGIEQPKEDKVTGKKEPFVFIGQTPEGGDLFENFEPPRPTKPNAPFAGGNKGGNGSILPATRGKREKNTLKRM